VLEAMLTAAESWAREVALHRLRLYVHEDNRRARAAYRRLGLVDTGGILPYPPDPSRVEQELAK
jgi:RimJ/RimL family protein N-acetyltransferase